MRRDLCAIPMSEQKVQGRSACGMTLVELLIVIVALGILAAIVFPKYNSIESEARAKSAASNVRRVRELIQVHRHSGLYPLNEQGVPEEIHAEWFRGTGIPEHSWTGRVMRIQRIAAGEATLYPLEKTFDLNDANAVNAWYNLDNGRFCILVPPRADDADTLALFNLANSCEATSLDQTQ